MKMNMKGLPAGEADKGLSLFKSRFCKKVVQSQQRKPDLQDQQGFFKRVFDSRETGKQAATQLPQQL